MAKSRINMHPLGTKQPLHRSLRSALRGFTHAATERNFILLLGASIIACALLIFYQVPMAGRVLVLTLCAATLAAEIFNTAIEELSDALVQEHHPGIAKTKELSASAVLLLALTTLGVTLHMLY